MKIKMIVDSTFNLLESTIVENNIDVIPLNVIVDGISYKDGVDISFNEIMEQFNEGKHVSTSQPSPMLYIDSFEKAKEEGYTDILCMTISSTLSGTIQAATIASREVEGINVHIYDTLSAAIGSEMLALIAMDEIKEGTSIDVITKKLDAYRANGGILMSMENLTSLKKSGRISKIKATIGNLLRVKPIIEYFGGKVTINSKLRTEAQVADWIAEKMKSIFENVTTKIHLFVAYVKSMDRLTKVLEKLKETFPHIEITVRDGITPVIAVNLGYGGLGVAWCYE